MQASRDGHAEAEGWKEGEFENRRDADDEGQWMGWVCMGWMEGLKKAW